MVATRGFQSSQSVGNSMTVVPHTGYTTGTGTPTAKLGQQRFAEKDRLEAAFSTDSRNKATRVGSDSAIQQSQSKPRRLLGGINDGATMSSNA